MSLLDELLGRIELNKQIESLNTALQSCNKAREDEKSNFENKYVKLESKYKEAEVEIASLKEEFDRINSKLEKREETPVDPLEELPEKPFEEQLEQPEKTKSPKSELETQERKYDAFGWVLLTPEYKKMLSFMLRKEKTNKCIICKKETSLDDISLHNAWRVHKSCYEEYLQKVCSVEKSDAKKYYQENMETVCLLKTIHSFWYTYPPDWEQRCKMVLRRANYACENIECGESEDGLYIHHEYAINIGGNHDLKNLVCLCETCYDEVVPRELSEGPKPEPSWIKRKELIREAIDKNTNISFNYINRKRERSTRTITPTNFETFDEAGRHLGVRGYCFLRKTVRSFYIRRMSRLTILPDISSVGKNIYHEIYPEG